MRTRALRRHSGFTLVEVMIVVAIMGLLAAIALPNMVKARTRSQQTVCIKNLQMIDGAKETWALETRRGPGDTVIDTEVDTYIKGGAPVCPTSGVYNYGRLTAPPTCTVAGHVLPPDAAAASAGGEGSGTGGSGTGGDTGDPSGAGGGSPAGDGSGATSIRN